jgi:hypothetical protein
LRATALRLHSSQKEKAPLVTGLLNGSGGRI